MAKISNPVRFSDYFGIDSARLERRRRSEPNIDIHRQALCGVCHPIDVEGLVSPLASPPVSDPAFAPVRQRPSQNRQRIKRTTHALHKADK
jgi:hypothetical protein